MALSGDAARKGVQSIEVGGELLKVLCRHAEPLMLKEIAQEAGMAAAKAHPYLVSFCKVGLVEQNSASGSYRLGALALRLGMATLAQSDQVQRSIASLGALKGQARHTAALSVWGQHGPTVVHWSEIEFPLETNLRVGSVMSLLTTATGRVFTAFLPSAMTVPLIEAELARTLKTRVERDRCNEKLWAEVQHIRDRGMARALGNPLPGVNALSAPVFDRDGKLALVITMMGRDKSFDASWTGPIARDLQQCCESSRGN